MPICGGGVIFRDQGGSKGAEIVLTGSNSESEECENESDTPLITTWGQGDFFL